MGENAGNEWTIQTSGSISALDWTTVLSNVSLRPLWLVIRLLVSDCSRARFWHMRSCFFLSLPLQPVPSDLWKEAYYDVSRHHPKPATTQLLLQATLECDYDWNSTLKTAIELGEPEVVKLLMRDPRVDPTLVLPSCSLPDLKNDERLASLIPFITDPRVRFSNPLFFGMAYVVDHVTCEDRTMDQEKMETLDFHAMMRSWEEHQERSPCDPRAVMDSCRIDEEKMTALDIGDYVHADGTLNLERVATLHQDIAVDDSDGARSQSDDDSVESEDGSLDWIYDSD